MSYEIFINKMGAYVAHLFLCMIVGLWCCDFDYFVYLQP